MSARVDITIEVPLPPRGKGRPRASSVNGRASVYTPSATRRWEAQLALMAQAQVPNHKQLEGPLWVDILAIVPRPKRLMRKKDPDAEVWSEVKPDIDNIDKSVLDALKAFWRDDAQICRLVTEKAHAAKGERARVYVRIRHAVIGPGGQAFLDLGELKYRAKDQRGDLCKD